MAEINEDLFEALLKKRLGQFWDRAHTVFHNYGKLLSDEVTNVLLHAIDKEKVDDVLKILGQHFEKHLQFQHPKIRGSVSDHLLVTNPTKIMFLKIYTETLGLKPVKMPE